MKISSVLKYSLALAVVLLITGIISPIKLSHISSMIVSYGVLASYTILNAISFLALAIRGLLV
jgi:hypothetical protein